MHQEYDGKLQILAFPCNQFGAQEPWPESQIKDWVTSKYGVRFPLMKKICVKGDDAHDLFAKAQTAANEQIGWNFAKFLLDKDGRLVKFYGHRVQPIDATDDIKSLMV